MSHFYQKSPSRIRKNCLNLVSKSLNIWVFPILIKHLLHARHWRINLLPNISWVEVSPVMKCGFLIIITNRITMVNTYWTRRIHLQNRITPKKKKVSWFCGICEGGRQSWSATSNWNSQRIGILCWITAPPLTWLIKSHYD